MPGLISASEAASIREALDLFLVHTYARVPVDQTGADQGYGPTDVERTPVAGLPCKYAAETRIRLAGGDRVLVNVPTLTVPASDVTKVGDEVQNVADSDGTLMLAGPIRVYDVQASAGLGPTLKKRLILQGGDIT